MAEQGNQRNKRWKQMATKKAAVPAPSRRNSRVPARNRASSSSQGDIAPTLPENWFVSNEAREIYVNFKHVSQMQFFFNFTDFTSNLALVREWFDSLNLTRFVTQSYITYDDMVKMFYANFTPSSHIELNTRVCGVDINLTPSVIAEIFDIPDDGRRIDSTLLDDPRIYEVICDNENRNSRAKPSSCELSVETRVLFLYFSHFLCKQGSHTDYPKIQQNLVFCVKAGIPFNIPRLMIETMKQRRNFRPFHMLLTPIFQHFGIPLTGTKFFRPEQCINLAKLKVHLLIQENEHGVFVRRQGRVHDLNARQEAREDVDVDEEEEDLKEYVDNRINELQVDMNNRMDEHRSHIDAVHRDISTQLSAIMDHLRSFQIPPPGGNM